MRLRCVMSFGLTADRPKEFMDWTELRSETTKFPDNQCLYRLRGDTLVIIGGGPDQRPARFFSGPGAEPKALMFTRVRGNEPAEP